MASRAATLRDLVRAKIPTGSFLITPNAVESSYETETKQRRDFPSGVLEIQVTTAIDSLVSEPSPLVSKRSVTLDTIPIGVRIIAGVETTDTVGVDPVLETSEQIQDWLRTDANKTLGEFTWYSDENIRAVDPETTAKTKVVEFAFVVNYLYERPRL